MHWEEAGCVLKLIEPSPVDRAGDGSIILLMTVCCPNASIPLEHFGKV